MRKASEMIGLPVIVRESGEKVETVKDVLFDKTFTKVIGFLVTEDGWFAMARVLPWLGVLYPITKEAIFIESERIIVDAEQLAPLMLERDQLLEEMPLRSKDGAFLGKLQQIYFNQETGQLEGLEVSGGLFVDRESGGGFVPVLDRLELKSDAIIVSLETVLLIEKEEAQAATSKALSPSIKGLLGRRVRQPVQTDAGLYVAVTGQMVTEHVLQLAKVHQKEEALLKAVNNNHRDSTPADSNQETSLAPVQELLEVVEEGISGLLGMVSQFVPFDEQQPTSEPSLANSLL